jgi:ribosomal protein S27AE
MQGEGGREKELDEGKHLETQAASAANSEETTCPRCGESHDLAKVKGCIKCLKCGFKFDCNGW